MKMKSKLMAVSLMLVVSILMMTTASFAWFTISTAPEITGLTTTVVTNENLEIAFAKDNVVPVTGAANDTGNQTKWGNVIDMTDSDETGFTSAFDKTLRPLGLNTAKTGFEYPLYGNDGRISSFEAFTESATAVATVTNIKDKDNNVYGYYYDMWIRTNTKGAITLQEAAGVDRYTDGTEGKGSNIAITTTGAAESTAIKMAADYLKVGFKVLGSSALTYTGGTDGAAMSYTNVTVSTAGEITPFTKTANGDGKYNLSGTVVSADDCVANTAYLVRVYVWLDGGVTNAAASLDTAVLNGAINLQFTVANVDNSMKAPAAPAVTEP